MIGINFQWHIDYALFDVARSMAQNAIDSAIDANWHYNTSIPDGVLTIRVARRGSNDYKKLAFNLAGHTIDAALLEQLHDEVTAWFTAIKEGASA